MTSKETLSINGASHRIGVAVVQAVAVLFSVIIVAAGLTSFAAVGTAAASTRGDAPAAGPAADPSALVNQFIGTENEGWDIPAVAEPFGMVGEAPLVLNRPGKRGNNCDSQSANKIYGLQPVHHQRVQLQLCSADAHHGAGHLVRPVGLCLELHPHPRAGAP